MSVSTRADKVIQYYFIMKEVLILEMWMLRSEFCHSKFIQSLCKRSKRKDVDFTVLFCNNLLFLLYFRLLN